MIAKIISGGQTGADQAGWRAAKRCGLPTGGYMPIEFRTEAGNMPKFEELYGATELTTSSYQLRTQVNVRESDLTLWFGRLDSRGFTSTSAACKFLFRPMVSFPATAINPAKRKAYFLLALKKVRELSEQEQREIVINVAGNRESGSPSNESLGWPGIGAWTEGFLVVFFGSLGFPEKQVGR